jgi:hypothetical protein
MSPFQRIYKALLTVLLITVSVCTRGPLKTWADVKAGLLFK